MPVFNLGSTNDNFTATTSADTVFGGAGNDTLQGSGGNDSLDGGEGNDSLLGGSGVDTLRGGLGNDTLDGGIGNDSMDGGAGGDTYLVDSTSDLINDTGLASDGFDTIITAVALASLHASIENLTLGGTVLKGVGNASNNVLTGNASNNTLTAGAGDDFLYGLQGNDTLKGEAGSDTLDGGLGNDSMDGGAGADTYLVDSVSDVLNDTGLSTDGKDTVVTTVALASLNGSIENLTLGGTVLTGFGNISNNVLTGNASNNTLTAGAGDDVLHGLQGNDTLKGEAGNDTLDGGLGNDSMDGGAGSDTYYVDSVADVVADTGLATDGTDLLVTSVALGALAASIENLTLSGTVLNAVGNSSNNVITGNGLDNLIDAGEGNDSVHAGDGHDDVIGEGGNDFLSGGNGDDTLYGGQFDIGSGEYVLDDVSDTLVGGAGSDTYYVNIANASSGTPDVIQEAADTVVGNADTVILLGSSFASYAMTSEVERLQVGYGTASVAQANLSLFAVDIVGNESNNRIYATGGANVIDAGAGNDVVYGANGDDGLFGGTGADNLIGGAGNDTLFGGSYDMLSGQFVMDLEVDTLSGGQGDDLYIYNSSGDVLVDQVGDGFDTIETKLVSINLLDFAAEIEGVRLAAGAGLSATGNTLANHLEGNANSNTLKGLAGNDTLQGQGGNDLIYGGHGNDVIMGGDGSDVLGVGVYEFYADPMLENDSAGSDWVDGGFGDDILFGYQGVDTLIGGVGNDFYILEDDSSSLLIELEDEGFDTVRLSGADVNGAFQFDLADNIEAVSLDYRYNLSLGALLLGNGLSNSLSVDYVFSGNVTMVGGAGNDTLSGFVGDVLIGGVGDDVYKLAGAEMADIQELANEGRDAIWFYGAGTYVLDNIDIEDAEAYDLNPVDDLVEGLQFDITGNEVANSLKGSRFEDVLSGLGGNDVLIGASGNDSLIGGDGDDTLLGGDGDDVLEGGAGVNFLEGGAGSDLYRVTNATSSVVENDDEVENFDILETSVNFNADNASTAGIEAFVLLGSESLSVTGNSQSNTMIANDAGSRLNGVHGNDDIIGGAGNDTLIGGYGNDILIGGGANDLMGGGADADELVGEGGNDTMDGGSDSDLFTLSGEFGADVIRDTNGADDRVAFLDVSYNTLWMTQSGQNLEVVSVGTTNKVVLENWFSNTDKVERIVSSEGLVLSAASVGQLVQVMAGFMAQDMSTTNAPAALLSARDQAWSLA